MTKSLEEILIEILLAMEVITPNFKERLRSISPI